MNDRATITFSIEHPARFKAAYRKALKSSGLDEIERREKLVQFNPEAALAEIMADARFNWENYGLGY